MAGVAKDIRLAKPGITTENKGRITLRVLLITYFPSIADGPSLLIFRRRMRMQPVVGLVIFELHSPPI